MSTGVHCMSVYMCIVRCVCTCVCFVRADIYMCLYAYVRVFGRAAPCLAFPLGVCFGQLGASILRSTFSS